MRCAASRVARQREAVHLVELVERHHVGGRIEVVEIGDENAARVPQLAVDVDDARQDLLADAQLLGELGHRHPQPDDLGAALLDHVLRRRWCCRPTSTSCGLRGRSGSRASAPRGTAAARASPAPRAASSGTSRGAGRCLRGTCPTASRARRARGSTASWLEPESNQTSRMSCSRSNEVPPHDGQVKPSGRNSSIGRSYQASALYCSKTDGRLVDDRRRQDRLAARRAVDRRNRHAPRALARDAPVGPVRHHVEDAVAAPGGNPLHLVVDRVLRGVAQRPRLAVLAGDHRLAVHAHEPLRRGEEDHRVVAAPAVRVLVRERLAVPEPAALVQRLLDLRVGVEHALAAEELARCRGSARPVRPARRSRARTSRRSGSRRRRGPAPCAPRRCPARA